MLSALGELRQEDCKFEADLDNWVYLTRPCLKKKKEREFNSRIPYHYWFKLFAHFVLIWFGFLFVLCVCLFS